MNKTLYLLILFTALTGQSLFSQVITTDPAFPTETDPVTIIFNAREAEGRGQDLVGFDGELYAHTGVIISEQDQSTGNWSYVVTDWGENTDETRLTNIGEDLWELQIENIREYYGVPETVDRIYQLAFVFRSADTEIQTDDLFVDIFQDQLVVQFAKPSVGALDPYFAEVGESVEFQVIGNSPQGTLSSITLFQGETQIASVSNRDTLETNVTVTQSGETFFRALGEDATGSTVEDDLSIIVNPELVRQQRPQGIEDGVTISESGASATLSVYAPGKQFAYLIGSFNNWQVDPDYFMKLDEASADSAHFWIEIDGLTPGEPALFQYYIDGEIRVADLYSELVLDPDFDRFISSDTYPDMPGYPTGLTREIVSVIEPDQPDYEWEVTNFEPPANEELIVYELLLRDFLEDNNFETLTDTLGYLENLGVNAIELMPVSEFDGNISWGYNPTFHGALDKEYGTKQAFKQFVDEAHKRGMAVLLDVVYNHAHDKSPLIRIHGSTRSENPMLGPGHAYNVFFHLNHNHPYIRYWLDRMNRYWLEEYNIDGYRFDLTKGFAPNVNNRQLLDGFNGQRIENLIRMANKIWEYDSEAIVILEHFAANSEQKILTDIGMLSWGNHNRNYNQATMGYRENSDFSGVHFRERGWSNPHLIGYMESHDEQWLMHRNLKYGNSAGDYDVTNLNTALNRQKMIGAFFFTIPGPKMIWQFGELGYGGLEDECLKPGDGGNGECASSDPGRTAPKPIRWEYMDDNERYKLYRSWSELLRLRNSSPVFTSPETEFSASLNTLNKSMVLEHEEMDAVIIGNFDVERSEMSVDFSITGEWFEFITGSTLQVDELRQEFSLAPGEVRLYTSNEVEPAEEGIFFSEGESGFGTLPEQFELHPNYPNPFNPVTQLSYDVPEVSDVTLEVFDIMGRKVATIVDESEHPAGSFTVPFRADRLSSGVYIARMVGGSSSSIQKMTFIK